MSCFLACKEGIVTHALLTGSNRYTRVSVPEFEKQKALRACKTMLLWLPFPLLQFSACPCPQKPAAPVSSVACEGTAGTHAFSCLAVCQSHWVGHSPVTPSPPVGLGVPGAASALESGSAPWSALSQPRLHKSTVTSPSQGHRPWGQHWAGKEQRAAGLSEHPGRC